MTAAGSELYRLVPLVTAVRWATTALGILLLSTREPNAVDAVLSGAVISYSLWRTVRPLDFSGRPALWAILAEGAVMVTAVVSSGYWDSPFVFSLVAVISAAGFARGIPWALCAALACITSVALPYHLDLSNDTSAESVQWAGELILVAILAGYVRYLSSQARAETTLYAGRLQQLSEVNDLLVQLRRVAQALPMTLDLTETLDSSVRRLRELFQPEVLLLLLRESDSWSVATASGVELTGQLPDSKLPLRLRQCLEPESPVSLRSLGDASGVSAASTSGIYARLCARDELIGLVAVERCSGAPYAADDAEIMKALVEQMGFSIDNARWFSRIGTLAAEQERNRIARDLHDRVGQELALVGFELDRFAKNASNPEIRLQVLELRQCVRSVVSELRETLYDLRTEVSEDMDLVGALSDFLERVGRRSGLAVDFQHRASKRLALTVERETWRIAQEAILNVERHAHATAVQVRWSVNDTGAELEVLDDGQGMPRESLRSDGYGILGMHERAQAIGASLTITSSPMKGTTVRLTVPTVLAGRP